jgi:hypothetical protein
MRSSRCPIIEIPDFELLEVDGQTAPYSLLLDRRDPREKDLTLRIPPPAQDTPAWVHCRTVVPGHAFSIACAEIGPWLPPSSFRMKYAGRSSTLLFETAS